MRKWTGLSLVKLTGLRYSSANWNSVDIFSVERCGIAARFKSKCALKFEQVYLMILPPKTSTISIWPLCLYFIWYILRLWSINEWYGMKYTKTWVPFYWHELTLIPACISYYIHHRIWDEVTYPFPNLNGETNEAWERISNFISYISGHVITYTSWNKS